MKILKSTLAVILILLLSLVSPFAVFADDGRAADNLVNTSEIQRNSDDRDSDWDEEENDDDEDENENEDEDEDEDQDVNKDEDEDEDEDEDDDALEQQKEQLKQELEDLKEQLETAEKAGNTSLVAELKTKITEIKAEIDALDEEEEDKEEDEEDKAWEIAKDVLEQEKDALEVQKDQIEEEIEELEEQLEVAEESGDTALVQELRNEIAELKAEKEDIKRQMKSKIEQMKEVMKQRYTAEELDELAAVSKQFSSMPKVTVLPVENVFMAEGNVKFDTPPVIKEGRTLLPVRAISEATGAVVGWNAEEKKVTITKGDKTIVLILGESTVYVNGTEEVIDVPAQLMNNRTMVPLRFIAESLDKEVEWDAETCTIEISEPVNG